MTPAHSTNDRLFWILTTIVVLAPLPLASNRPWSWSLLSLAVALLTLWWAVARWTGRSRSGLPLNRLALPAALFLLAVGWAVVQTLPIVPLSWTHPIWTEASVALGQDGGATISGAPEKTQDAVMRLLAYGLVFFLATQIGRRSHRAALAVRVVALAIVVYGCAALVFYFFDLDYVLWLPKWAYHGDATGTFVGRAAFGAFAGIGVLLCLAKVLESLKRRAAVLGSAERVERLFSETVPWGAAMMVLWLAILASHSRGALLVTGLACVVMIVAAGVARLLRLRVVLWVLLVFVLLGIAVTMITGHETVGRLFSENDSVGDRSYLLRLTWLAIGDAPFQGHGLGAFEQTFFPYRDLGLPRPVLYDFAHNTWEEIIMDLGWPAGLCLIGSGALAVLACVRGVFVRRKNQLYPIVALGITTVLVGQSVLDFTIQIPALAVLFAYFLGIGYGQSWSQAKPQDAVAEA